MRKEPLKIGDLLKKYNLLVLLIVFVVISSILSPNFMTLGNLLTLCAMTLTDKDKILPVSSSPKYNLPVPSFFMLDTQKKAEATVQAMFDAMARNAPSSTI